MIGSGFTAGRFQAVLGLDTKDYAKGVINAQTLNKVFGESFTAFVSNPLLGGFNLLKNYAVALTRAAGQQLAFAETLQRTAQATGASEQLLVALIKRLEVAGYSGDIAAKAMQKFGTELFNFQRGSGPLKEVADALGLTLDAAAPLEQNLRALLDAIAQLPSETQRSAAAAKVFGEEAGLKLLNAIGGGSQALRTMIEEARMLGFVVDKAGNDSLAGMNTQLGYLQKAVEGIKFNALQSFLEGLNQSNNGNTGGILNLANSINQELGPAMRDLGREMEPIIKDLPDAIRSVSEYLSNFIDGMKTLNDLWEGSWFQKFTQWRAGMIEKGFEVVVTEAVNASRTPNQQRVEDEFQAIRARRAQVPEF